MQNIKTDEELMRLLQKGNTYAMEELYRRYSSKLLRLAFKMVNGNEALAQDILHDVFVQIIEKPERFDVSREFRPWVYTLAANACRKTYRIISLQSLDEVPEQKQTSEEAGEALDAQTLQRSINWAMDNILSYEQREVMILRHQQELSVKEIAAILQCPEGTVKSRLHTSRKLLAKKLKSHHPNSMV